MLRASLYDVPGYVQGFRFKNDSEFYDSGAKVFHDLAGYGSANGLTITTGTPSFASPAGANSQEGMTLDNTVQGDFLPAIPWEGTMIVAHKPAIVGATTHSMRVVLFGSATTATSNGNFTVTHNSTQRRSELTSAAGTNQSTVNKTSDAVQVVAFAKMQNTRKGYVTIDGVTVTETAAVSAANNGNGLAMGWHNGTSPNGQRARFGNLSGTIGDTVAFSTGSTVTMFEMHFYKGNPMVDNPTEFAALMAAINTDYGL